MDKNETNKTNIEDPEKEFMKVSSDEKKEDLQKKKIKPRTYQSDKPYFAKYKYLLNFKRWPIFDFLEPDFIVEIHMAMILKDEGILIVTRDKMVYAFGNNTNKLLGIRDKNVILKPTKIEALCGKNIKKFVSWEEKYRMYALTEEGEAYHWGYNEKELKKVSSGRFDEIYKSLALPTQIREFRDKYIKDIKCNITHSLALTSSGEVYIWGYSKYFKYTLETLDPAIYFSKDIKQIHFGENKIIRIACGNYFSVAISDTYKLYIWGTEGDHLLEATSVLYNTVGINSSSVSHSDTIRFKNNDFNIYLVPDIKQIEIAEVICGNVHIVVRSKKGKLFIWGDNKGGQLGGDQNIKSYLHPICIDIPKIKKIAIGQNHKRNIAVCEDNTIYVWGRYDTALYFDQNDWAMTITQFSSMQEALMSCDKPLMIFANDLEYMDEEMDVLKCWENLFNNSESSDFKIQVEGQLIHVHEVFLKKRSSHFGKLLQEKDNLDIKEEKDDEGKSVKILNLQPSKYSYIVYKAYIQYLYTGVIDLHMKQLSDLLKLAIEFGESKLERYCKTKLNME